MQLVRSTRIHSSVSKYFAHGSLHPADGLALLQEPLELLLRVVQLVGVRLGVGAPISGRHRGGGLLDQGQSLEVHGAALGGMEK